jgi:chemotaxis protein MotB
MAIKKLIAGCLLLSSLGVFAQSKPNTFFMSKRYKACLAERDGLCSDNRELRNEIKALKQDTASLHTKIKQQDSAYNALNGKYNQLASTSDSKLADLSAKLDTKSRELNAKEQNLQQKDKRLKELESLLAKQDSILNQLNNTIKNALLGFKSDEFSTEMKNGKVYVRLSDKLLFKSGAVNIEDKGKEAIKKLAEVLNKNADIDIAVEGHTDSIPIKTAQYKDNWDLSVARATNIVRSLNEEHRVDAKRLTSSGKGEFVPVASNSTPEGRAKNRRTEIVLSPKLEELFKMLDNRKK